MADILKSFIEQNYGSIENARKADREADLRDAQESSGIYSVLADMAKRTGRTFGDNTISREGITNNPDISNNNKEYKSHFKDYDHSLEMPRDILNRGDFGDITFEVD